MGKPPYQKMVTPATISCLIMVISRDCGVNRFHSHRDDSLNISVHDWPTSIEPSNSEYRLKKKRHRKEIPKAVLAGLLIVMLVTSLHFQSAALQSFTVYERGMIIRLKEYQCYSRNVIFARNGTVIFSGAFTSTNGISMAVMDRGYSPTYTHAYLTPFYSTGRVNSLNLNFTITFNSTESGNTHYWVWFCTDNWKSNVTITESIIATGALAFSTF